MKQRPAYEEKIVAFVDILGSRSIIKMMENDDELHQQFYNALMHISREKTTQTKRVQVSVFSDNIVITAAVKDLLNVVWCCGWLQAELLTSGILLRGGISVGKITHTDSIIYGSGLVKAYEMESKEAHYPRILLDDSLISPKTAKIQSLFLSLDIDGRWFIDPFSLGATVGDAEEQFAEAYDPHEIYFDHVMDVIRGNLGKDQVPAHRSKWAWMENKCTKARDAYQSTGELGMTRMMRSLQKAVKRSI